MHGDDFAVNTTDSFDDNLVQDLEDGFQRLGGTDTPFTLREHPDKPTPAKKERAEQLHRERPEAERRRDEMYHEPVTRDIDDWRNNMNSRDFPGVDTVHPTLQQQRATVAADIARSSFGVTGITRDVDFEDPAVRGRYFRGVREIEMNTSAEDFPGWGETVTLCHEVGHAVDDAVAVKTGFASERGEVFDTDQERREARTLSERVRGPITDSAIPGALSYRELDSEKVADTFASMILEPERSEAIAPAATDQIRSTFDDFFVEMDAEQERITEQWMRL